MLTKRPDCLLIAYLSKPSLHDASTASKAPFGYYKKLVIVVMDCGHAFSSASKWYFCDAWKRFKLVFSWVSALLHSGKGLFQLVSTQVVSAGSS